MKITQLILLTLSILVMSNCSSPAHSAPTANSSINDKQEPTNVSTLKITTLSTMLANQGVGEWGYSALVEVDSNKVLFDTGRRPETVLDNADALGIDLSDVEDVFLSHNHGDHTGGLVTLRNRLKVQNPKAISRIHVGEGIFSQRVNARNRMQEIKEELEADGVTFIVYNQASELFPGVWITGPIERIHEEKNYGGKWKIATPEGTVIDNIPEDQSLAINTDKGFVMVAGCGHAGVINTLEHIQTNIHDENIHAIIGGFHLVQATDQHLAWTGEHLGDFGVEKIIGAHCTGIHALYTLKDLLEMERGDAVVGSIGDSFDLVDGITPGIIAM